MYTFSIVIPIVGDAGLFDDTLASVLRFQPENCQVIAVHTSDYEDPHQLANDGVELIAIQNRTNLIPFFNAGVKQASGDIVAFIRPGIELTENWHVPVVTAFEEKFVGSVAPLIISGDNQPVATGVGLGVGFKRKLVRSDNGATELLGPTSWAGFYRREWLTALFDEIGSIDDTLESVYMDLELGLCMSTLGFDCEPTSECVLRVHSAKSLVEESRIPHGASAQRSYCRHVLRVGTTASQVQSTLAKLFEVVTSPFGLWQLKHVGQRSLAGRFRDRDEVFSDDLSVVTRKLRREELKKSEENVRLTIYRPEPENDTEALVESEQFEAAQRNATSLVSEKRKIAKSKSSVSNSPRRSA